MRHEEFEQICSKVGAGRERHLKHIVTHQVGTLMACDLDKDFFEVEVNGERKFWSKENVKPAD